MNNIKSLEPHEFCFVIDNGNLQGDEHDLFFQCPKEDVVVLHKDATMADVLVHAGIFKSKTQVRKDQKWGKNLELHWGFDHHPRIGKKRMNIAIFKPEHSNRPSILAFVGDKSNETR